MKIAILSRNSGLYSTRRLIEAGKARGHEIEVIDTLTKSKEDKFVENSYGEFTWSDFQRNWIENSQIYKFNIHSTGILRTLYSEYLKLDYDYIGKYGCQEHPMCYETDDIPIYLVDSISNHYMFYNFLARLTQEISNKIKE